MKHAKYEFFLVTFWFSCEPISQFIFLPLFVAIANMSLSSLDYQIHFGSNWMHQYQFARRIFIDMKQTTPTKRSPEIQFMIHFLLCCTPFGLIYLILSNSLQWMRCCCRWYSLMIQTNRCCCRCYCIAAPTLFSSAQKTCFASFETIFSSCCRCFIHTVHNTHGTAVCISDSCIFKFTFEQNKKQKTLNS